MKKMVKFNLERYCHSLHREIEDVLYDRDIDSIGHLQVYPAGNGDIVISIHSEDYIFPKEELYLDFNHIEDDAKYIVDNTIRYEG